MKIKTLVIMNNILFFMTFILQGDSLHLTMFLHDWRLYNTLGPDSSTKEPYGPLCTQTFDTYSNTDQAKSSFKSDLQKYLIKLIFTEK